MYSQIGEVLGLGVETIVLFPEERICDNLVEFSDGCN
jgi:hypothetical protein